MKKHFCFHTFDTKEQAEAFAKLNRKRKYTISPITDQSGWVLTYNEWH